jgi:hypothetical protein
MSDLSADTPKKKNQYFYLAFILTLLPIVLTFIPDPSIQLVAIFLFYASLFGWFVFLIVIWVRWIAKTAEVAGRSYLGFMILGIFFPLIATIIVLTFKKPSN